MSIATIIYLLLMALLVFRRVQAREIELDFHSSNVAKAAMMIIIEQTMKYATIFYAIALFIIWI